MSETTPESPDTYSFVKDWGTMSPELRDILVELAENQQSAVTPEFRRMVGGVSSLHALLSTVDSVGQLNSPENYPQKEELASPIEVSPEMRVALEQLGEIHGISADAIQRRASVLKAFFDAQTDNIADQSE